MDRLTPQQRHYMAAIQGKDTKPEIVILKYRTCICQKVKPGKAK